MRRTRQHRQTAGYSKRQLCHLLTGHDWPFMRGNYWGELSNLPDQPLRNALADMLTCWRECQHLVTPEHCGTNDLGEPPWFQPYANRDGIERLYQEIMTDPLREWRLRVYPQHPVAGVVADE